MIKSNQVATLIVKDMFRLRRNYIEIGQLTETVLPMHDVRLIAVKDGVDSEKGEENSQGYAIGQPPLDYEKQPDNSKL